jgi:hypothetical protein
MNWLKRLLGGKAAKAAPETVATVQKLPGNIYVLRLGGKLNKATLDRIQAIAAQDIERGAKSLKILIILSDFKGWRQGDDWGNIDFFAQYEAFITRIAVVGEAARGAEAMAFLGANHRTGEVRFFTTGQEAQARAWLVAQ